jgi:hypothetical protein
MTYSDLVWINISVIVIVGYLLHFYQKGLIAEITKISEENRERLIEDIDAKFRDYMGVDQVMDDEEDWDDDDDDSEDIVGHTTWRCPICANRVCEDCDGRECQKCGYERPAIDID